MLITYEGPLTGSFHGSNRYVAMCESNDQIHKMPDSVLDHGDP